MYRASAGSGSAAPRRRSARKRRSPAGPLPGPRAGRPSRSRSPARRAGPIRPPGVTAPGSPSERPVRASRRYARRARHGSRARPGAQYQVRCALEHGPGEPGNGFRGVLPVGVERDDHPGAILERRGDAVRQRHTLPTIPGVNEDGRTLPPSPFPLLRRFPRPVARSVVHNVHDRSGNGAVRPGHDVGDSGGGLVRGDDDRDDGLSAPRHWEARSLRGRRGAT